MRSLGLHGCRRLRDAGDRPFLIRVSWADAAPGGTEERATHAHIAGFPPFPGLRYNFLGTVGDLFPTLAHSVRQHRQIPARTRCARPCDSDAPEADREVAP